ncbi:hypothetical protein GCM10007049_08600 [Echinicola pacifica]|uniref:Peptidyl-prolyl cis-trans isomerase n=1 Tax=Echinicola pacifica TaxID=346377 RepID=A0A918PPY3_9BACT|nr:FKBP-type peptidyl-prolyl cis-trans isomerase [Echinicola pacifica]GGZ18631.1 hypothetical protein GCM10007049_08600 [Echinicola pacifica]
MKAFNQVIIAALFAGLFASCVEDQETPLEIFERDLAAIEAYIQDTDYSYVLLDQDEENGIALLYGSTSDSGVKAEAGDQISVHYTLRLLDESLLQTTVEATAIAEGMYDENAAYEPYSYQYLTNSVIYGFDYAISKMEVGDKARVIIPSYYAYGASARNGIPANSVLIFDLELVEVD